MKMKDFSYWSAHWNPILHPITPALYTKTKLKVADKYKGFRFCGFVSRGPSECLFLIFIKIFNSKLKLKAKPLFVLERKKSSVLLQIKGNVHCSLVYNLPNKCSFYKEKIRKIKNFFVSDIIVFNMKMVKRKMRM